MSTDSGLVKRGLILLALMTALAGVVLAIIFQHSSTTLPTALQRPELWAALVIRSDAGFPAAVSWPGVYEMGEAFPSAPGWLIRYNAAGALARRGSPNVPWNIIEEMLDEKRQMHNFRVQLQDGTMVPDEAAARLTMINALRAIGEWHKKQGAGNRIPTPELTRVYTSVDRLASSPIMEIRTQAENARQLFSK